MDVILVLVEGCIPVYVEEHRDLESAKAAADEIVGDYFEHGGPKDWGPRGRIRAYVWSTIDGQVVWSKGFE